MDRLEQSYMYSFTNLFIFSFCIFIVFLPFFLFLLWDSAFRRNNLPVCLDSNRGNGRVSTFTFLLLSWTPSRFWLPWFAFPLSSPVAPFSSWLLLPGTHVLGKCWFRSGEKEYFNKAMQGEEVAAFLPTVSRKAFGLLMFRPRRLFSFTTMMYVQGDDW